ncbi:MAG: hypothetical protein ACLQQ4_15040 [Bacteroidia bacterium]
MKLKKNKKSNVAAYLIILLLGVCTNSFAQQGTATSGNDFSNGTIMSSDNATSRDNRRMATKSYDENIIGVYYLGPNAVHNAMMTTEPLVSEGIVYVKYNSENGQIKKGDLITSSSTPGEGMKATKSGMVIGVALEDASGSSGLIKIRVLIQYVKQ